MATGNIPRGTPDELEKMKKALVQATAIMSEALQTIDGLKADFQQFLKGNGIPAGSGESTIRLADHSAEDVPPTLVSPPSLQPAATKPVFREAMSLKELANRKIPFEELGLSEAAVRWLAERNIKSTGHLLQLRASTIRNEGVKRKLDLSNDDAHMAEIETALLEKKLALIPERNK